MATEFHLRVRRILEAALHIAPAQREQAIRNACAHEPEVLSEALSLLPHYEQMRDYEPKPPCGTAWKLPGTTTFLKVRSEAHAPDVPEAEPQPPFTIDQYTVEKILGRGGMGVVYRAKHPTLHQDVAIKLLRRRHLAARDRWRFVVEEEILRQLRHPGIARFSYSGVVRLRPPDYPASPDEEWPYFVMEYVPGKSLTRYAADHQLDVRQRLALLVKICAAVEYAHDRGIVHCDLKPDNILVDAAGQPKIVDFGIAWITAFEGADAAEMRGVAGTLRYASPEQLVGHVDQLTPSADVYALGLIAHEVLTGHVPEREGGVVQLQLECVCLDPRAHRRDALNREFRYYLQGILATAVRQTRGQPYRSAGELGADLDSLLAQFPAESGWAAFKSQLASRFLPSAKWTPSTLSRPLSAVLRKRIGMGIEAGTQPPPEQPGTPPPPSR